jgi:hypothetical protein
VPNDDEKKFQKHEPCGYSFKVVSSYDEIEFKQELYRGPDAVKHFLMKILDTEDKIIKILKSNTEMMMTEEDKITHKNSTHCRFCHKELNGDSVRDHCHVTGKYRGASHNKCNINFKETPEEKRRVISIPVFFHNLTGYDGHLIIKGLNDKKFGNIRMIAQNFEKYMTFQVRHLKFLDSFNFLSSSLDKLSSNLSQEGEHKFINTLNNITDQEQRNLLLRKGVYPYEYITNKEVFEETQLPPIEKFYSSLNESSISESDYQHAQDVWDKFNIKNIGEYHDLYLKTDVLILADVFENFINTAVEFYNLDPCHYLTLPNFAWDAMLRKTEIELDQLTDIDKYQMIEKGLRGGISMITHRHGEANNKYLKDYDPSKESTYLSYLDANNLYGWAMIQQLPESNFNFVDKELSEILSTDDDDNHGYIVEVDLHYPKELHDLHNDYPLAPEQMIVNDNDLSAYQLDLKNKMELKNSKVGKLVPNLNDKKRYVLHYRNLKYYLDKGLIVTKLHRVLQFTQSNWLKTYIDFNTNQRAKAKNSFEKDFFKLMNNAVFGKTMENVRNHSDIQLINDGDKFTKLASKPKYKSCVIFDENLVAVECHKTTIKLNKPNSN